MEFANPIYSSVTSQFFKMLAEGINEQFEERCAKMVKERKYVDEIQFEVEAPREKAP